MIDFEARRKMAAYASILSIVLVTIYNLIRVGLEPQLGESVRVLGFAFFILNFPLFLIKAATAKTNSALFKDECAVTFLLLLFACLVGSVSINAWIFFLVLGAISFFSNFFLYLRSASRFEIISISFIVLLSVWLAIKVWEGSYIHPILLERLVFDERIHIDTLFHMSVAQMIKTYHIPSTGLNGIPFIHYHFGSHLIFACLSNSIGVGVFTFYQLAYPTIFVALVIKTILTLPIAYAERHGRTYKIDFWFWLILSGGIIGVFPTGEILSRAAAIPVAFIVSESYCVSLIFLFIIVNIIVLHYQKDSDIDWGVLVVILAAIFLMGLAKISTVVLFDVALGYLFLRQKLFRRSKLIVAYFLVGVMTGLCLIITMDPNSPNGSFKFLHFFKSNVEMSMVPFLLVYYFWFFALAFCVMFLSIFKLKNNSLAEYRLQKLFVEIAFVISVVGFLPGLFIYIEGGSAGYFMDIHRLVSIAFILVILPSAVPVFKAFVLNMDRLIPGKAMTVGVAIFALAVLFVVARNSYKATNIFVKHGYMMRNWMAGKYQGDFGFAEQMSINEMLKGWVHLRAKVDSNLQVNPIYKTLKKLDVMDTISLAKKSKSFYIPGDITDLRKYPCYKYPFLVPALTGVALKDAFVFEDCYGTNFGFEDYKRDELEKSKSSRFMQQEFILEAKDGHVELKPLSKH